MERRPLLHHERIKKMPRFLIAVTFSASLITPAAALDGFSTCHAAGTTVTSISGFDTRAAKMISEMMLADAMKACHRNSALNGSALTACAANLTRDGDSYKGPVTTVADCEKGTLEVEYSPVPASTYDTGPGSKHIDHYKFPVSPICGDDDLAAISAFKTLCPAYSGKIETDRGVVANVTVAGPKHIKVFRHATCAGKVGNYSVGVTTDRSIGSGDNMCYFASNSDLGRKILKTCPIGTDCHVIGTVENDQDAGDWSPVITEIKEVSGEAVSH
jgi:hypothetical protein